MRLTIVVVSWNTKDVLRDCLSRISPGDATMTVEIIVVDNASVDGSAEMVASEFPHVHLLRNSENVGFAAANNQAIRMAQGDYVLLLNSDAFVKTPDSLRAWIQYMDREPSVGASGCRLVWPDGRHQIGDGGFQPSMRSLLGHFWGLSYLAFSRFPPLFLGHHRLDGPTDVGWACGAACLVRRSILDRTGLLDDRIFMYAEDLEWCGRIRDAGHRITYLPDIQVVHLQGASASRSKGEDPSNRWLANLRAFYFVVHPKQPRVLYDLVVSVGLAARLVAYSLLQLGPRRAIARERCRTILGYLRFSARVFGRTTDATGTSGPGSAFPAQR